MDHRLIPAPPPFQPGLHPEQLPASFAPATFVSCSTDVEPIQAQGLWEVEAERRATSGLDTPLVAALKAADQSQGCSFLCCTGVPGSGLRAYRRPRSDDPSSPPHRLVWRTAESRSRRTATATHHDNLTPADGSHHQTESPQAIATGCSQQFKDLFDQSFERLVPRSGGPLFTPAPTSIRVCVYRDDPPDAQGDVAGTLLRDGSLSSGGETTLLNGLGAGRPTTTCPTVHGQFAVVTAGSSGSYATVELGGCDRGSGRSPRGRAVQPATQVGATNDWGCRQAPIGDRPSQPCCRRLPSIGRLVSQHKQVTALSLDVLGPAALAAEGRAPSVRFAPMTRERSTPVVRGSGPGTTPLPGPSMRAPRRCSDPSSARACSACLGSLVPRQALRGGPARRAGLAA